MEERWWWRFRSTRRRGGIWLRTAVICGGLGLVFVILGIIGDATNRTLGLEASSWFLLAITAFVYSVSEHIHWAVAVHLDTIEAGKKE